MPGAKEQNENGNPGDGQNTDDAELENQEGSGEGEGQGGDDEALYSDPAKAKELVKKLRAEAAKHRTKAKEKDSLLKKSEETLSKLKKAIGGESEEEDPAEALQSLKGKTTALESELAIRDLADEHGVPPAQRNYFKFLLAQKFEALGEGDELSDESLDEVLKEVRGIAGKQGSGGTGAGAGGGKGGGGNPPPAKGDKLTVEDFVKMNSGEKSALYVKDKAQYDSLFKEAVAKRIL